MWKAPTMASLHIAAPIWLMTQKTSQEYLSRCAAAVLWGWQCAHVLHQAWTFADSDPKLRSGPKNCVLRCVFCVCKDTNLRKLSNLSPPQGYVDSRKSRLFNLMIFQYVSLFSQQTLWSWRLQCWITRVNTYLIDIQNLSGFKRQTTNNFFRRLFGSWWFVIIYLTTGSTMNGSTHVFAGSICARLVRMSCCSVSTVDGFKCIPISSICVHAKTWNYYSTTNIEPTPLHPFSERSTYRVKANISGLLQPMIAD